MNNSLLPQHHAGIVAQLRVVELWKIVVFQLICIADEEICHCSRLAWSAFGDVPGDL